VRSGPISPNSPEVAEALTELDELDRIASAVHRDEDKYMPERSAAEHVQGHRPARRRGSLLVKANMERVVIDAEDECGGLLPGTEELAATRRDLRVESETGSVALPRGPHVA
jgi:hypothetical protein